MPDIFIRDDDVNPYSDFDAIRSIYDIIRDNIPDAHIVSCVSLLAKTNNYGNVYPDTPLRGKPLKYFYDVDTFLSKALLFLGTIASHGLLHVDHSKLSYDAQEMSILTSCNYLQTKLFCAPFNGYNRDTIAICNSNGIELITSKYNWLSLEFNNFNINHTHWYFHSWRYSIDRIKRELEHESVGNCSNKKL